MTPRLAALAALVLLPLLLGCPAAEQAEPAPASTPTAVPVIDADQPSFGYIDSSTPQPNIGTEGTISGWALDAHGIAKVELVAGDGQRFALAHGLARSDVESAHPGYPDSARAGFGGAIDRALLEGFSSHVDVVVTDGAGHETRLGTPLAIGPKREQWRPLLEERPSLATQRFHILFATSNVPNGGAEGIATEFAAHTSETLRVGMRVPVLYMRTTRGRKHDWVFDADFDTSRMLGEYPIAEDSLAATTRYAAKHQLPILFTLNGGVWGDAGGTAPEWDLTDHLEETPANCQWNDLDLVVPDDHPGIPGAMAGLELGRALTLNVFAEDVRRYKKRNLQQAGARVAEFASEHPDLFVGVNLDPDVYMNPFFEGDQWYDYNPDTLKQFRHWLKGDGPYAGGVEPDLSSYRREPLLTLAELNASAGTDFETWADVDAPRIRSYGITDPTRRPHINVWEGFRRHVVDLHYDDLSIWLHESGVPPERIFSSQGFMPPAGVIDAFPIELDDRTSNYDTGGMTLEGALPRDGHIGAILYGDSATNDVMLPGRASLFRTFWEFDPGWAIVEFNPADLRAPHVVPAHGASYRALRDAFNYGARFVSPMAWNGINGANPDHPGFVSFMAVRRTPLEEAIRFFLDDRAHLPRGALLFPFGDFRHADDDGWRVESGARARATRGAWQLETIDGGDITLVSPPDLPLKAGRHDLLVLGVRAVGGTIDHITVEARGASSSSWRRIASVQDLKGGPNAPEGLRLPLDWGASIDTRELRLTLAVSSGTRSVSLDHVLLYPRAEPRD